MNEYDLSGINIRVRGIVQGVGFRPFVYSLAVQNNLTGWVRNTSRGVEIEINGSQEKLDTFLHELKTFPPQLARIDQIEIEPCAPKGYERFEILESQPKPGDFIPISPDIAICSDCQRELFDPADRRFRYPFINCTNCGPRFSIIKDIPYDRPKTSMSGFALCPDCLAEYGNPLDRRFHAQPVACSVCGPHIWFEVKGNTIAKNEYALQTARTWLAEGKILALKGLGGFHLACDALNPLAVAELRRRKKRSDKPFALMAFNLEIVKKYCRVNENEAALLNSRQKPIVVLEKLAGCPVAEAVAPAQITLGIMLAYTPLHLLILEPGAGNPEILVMTSGNLSEEPIAYLDEDALDRLAPLADGFLMHNRPIHIRVDDSVSRAIRGGPFMIRRARGFTPETFSLAKNVLPTLAAGGELKNTFCLARDQYAFISHHIGDLENFETLQSFEQGILHYQKLFRIHPEVLACDLHPDYVASRYIRTRAQEESLPLVEVQHHHAHLAACLADNSWNSSEPVIGLTFDGTGYGTDGAVWGGEVLLGGYGDFERRYHLAYTPLPGGDAAVRKPARMSLSHLWKAGIEWEPDFPPVAALCTEEREVLRSQLEHKINAPFTSSMGRFFDAASAIIGIRHTVNYEGQAAIEMEALAESCEAGFYPFAINGDQIDPAPLWLALLHDWRGGIPVSILAARVHNSVARLVLDLSTSIRNESGINNVALSGGVWQNKYLLERTLCLLEPAGFNIMVHRRVPANDGGIALGQIMVAIHTTS